jgi:hypothetical protein
MIIIRVFGRCKSWARVHPAQPVPIMAIDFCFSFEVRETAVVGCAAEVGEDGGEIVVLERVVTILIEVMAGRNLFPI